MELPRALAPWAQELAIFPPDVGATLGPMIERLAAAIGPLRRHSQHQTGDPDGLAGLTRRGSYERLLISEWLLADELPDEFVRRAVMGEHLFLQLARRAPVAAQGSLALFDVGPDQLGAPRLAQLATLIVLARRATAANAGFSWGVWQKPEYPLWNEVNHAAVQAWLYARSPYEADADTWALWQEKCAALPDLDDVWLIGGERLLRLTGNARPAVVCVQDVYEPDVRQLSVSLRRRSQPPRELTLTLPAENDCIRVLRDPFASAAARPLKTQRAPVSNLVFSASSSKLFARGRDGGVIAYPIPTSPRAGTGFPRLYTPRHSGSVIAVNRFGRAVMMFCQRDNRLRIEYQGKSSFRHLEGEYVSLTGEQSFALPSAEHALQPLLSLSNGSTMNSFWVTDDNDVLYRLGPLHEQQRQGQAATATGIIQHVTRQTLAVASVLGHIVYVAQTLSDDRWSVVSQALNGEVISRPLDVQPRQAFFGYGGSLAHEKFGLLAVEQPDHWLIISKRADMQLPKLSSETVVGVIQNPKITVEPSLVVLWGNQRTLQLHGKFRSDVLLTADEPIAYVTISSKLPYLAYVTIKGEVVVYSLLQRKVLCRFLPKEAA